MRLKAKLRRMCTVLAVVAPVLGCESSFTDAISTPVAGGSYRGQLRGPFSTPIHLSFYVKERRDGNLTGAGTLTASSGVQFSVHGSVRGDSLELTFLKANGEIGTFRSAFIDLDHRNITATVVTFGGYTESDVGMERYSVQGTW
jgi:hypothetical protein